MIDSGTIQVMAQVLRKEAHELSSVLLPLGGAALGGLVGYGATRESRKKVRNALLGSLLGAGGGVLSEGLIFDRESPNHLGAGVSRS